MRVVKQAADTSFQANKMSITAEQNGVTRSAVVAGPWGSTWHRAPSTYGTRQIKHYSDTVAMRLITTSAAVSLKTFQLS